MSSITWSKLVKQSDRIETAHMGHEDVDDHQVEIRSVESGETVGAAVCDRNPEAVLRPPGTNSRIDMLVVIDDTVRVTASLPLRFQPKPWPCFFCSESVHKSHFGRKLGRRLPPIGYCKHLCQVRILQNCNVRYILLFSRQARDRG
jgi:hypothetical protein